MVTVYTIGHSTRSQSEVFNLLAEHDIDVLMDVRSYPSSRHCPQWNQDAVITGLLALDSGGALPRYEHMPILGGKRKALPIEKSINGAWRNASFRGYADYMQRLAFEEGLGTLIERAATQRIAIMCSEAVWWKCHRSMIADALVAQGHEALHIMGPGKIEPHKLRDFARLHDDSSLYYPKAT